MESSSALQTTQFLRVKEAISPVILGPIHFDINHRSSTSFIYRMQLLKKHDIVTKETTNRVDFNNFPSEPEDM